VASVNGPAFDWAWLGQQIYYDWKRHEVRFSGWACDGQCGGWQRIFVFHCAASGPLVTCANALGDSIRYRPTATTSRGSIVFMRDERIWVMAADGSGQKTLTSGTDENPRWSHGHAWIVYEHSCFCRPKGDGELWIMRADGSAQRQVTNLYPAQAAFPSWSPDGKELAYVRLPSDGGGSRIWITGIDGSTGSAVTSGPDDNEPAWSPNGRYIAFIRSISRRPVLAVVDVKTGKERVVLRTTGTACADGWSSWSPDSSRIAVECGAHEAIWIVNADGSHLQRLVTGSHPAWSPDGRWIAYVAGPPSSIYKIHPDGTGNVQITHGRGAGGDSEPGW
jgi:TolB protein